MRYAILSDIHANEAALRAVLQDAVDAHAEKIICLGDVLGYGPDPVSTLELVYRRAHVCLAGNHDDAVANRFPTDDFTPFAAAAVARQRSQLSREAIDWLRRLPHVCEFPGPYDGATGAFACAHGEFADPKRFNYVLEPEDAMPSWLERTEQLLFVGHSHKPGIFVLGASGHPHFLEPADFVLEPGKRYLVNVGSVGYPRNGICRSFYCIYDDLSRAVFFRSLPFDLEGYSAKMHGQGLDEAPWMMKRERERKAMEVRGAAHFGSAEATSGSSPKGVQLKSLKKTKGTPAARALLPKIAQTSGGTTVQLRPPPEALKKTLPPPRRGSLVPALLICALIIAAAGIWCTYSLVKSLPSRDPQPRPQDGGKATASVVGAPEPKAPEQDPRFSDVQRLPEGWSAVFEHPATQKVAVEANLRREVTAFRITSEPQGTVRLSKTIPIVEKAPKVYWSVELLPASTPGPSVKFDFNARIRFFSAAGDELGGSGGSGKRSATNKSAVVPPGAVRAMMEVDCICEGTYDLAVPYFSSAPEPQRAKVQEEPPQEKPPPLKPPAKRKVVRKKKK